MTGTAPAPAIRLQEVTKVYPGPGGGVRALDHLSLEVHGGEFLAVTGPPGSGKSTLLRLMGCLEAPTAGEIQVGGRKVGALNDDDLSVLRREGIGFVFQQGNLLPLMTLLENMEVPLLLKGHAKIDRGRCRELLRAVGLPPGLDTRRPEELPEGQLQRAAIARALVNDPGILLCDEPAGNLDSGTGDGIMDLLAGLNREGRTIILATHNPRIAARAGRTVRLADGRLEA